MTEFIDVATIPEFQQGELQETKSESQNRYREDLIELRRAKVVELLSKGLNQSEVAKQLGVDKATISRDVKELKEGARERIKAHVEETLPFEHEKALAGLGQIIKSAWVLAESTKDERTRIAALQLAKDGYITQRDFLSDSNVLNKTLKWIEWAKKQLSGEGKSA